MYLNNTKRRAGFWSAVALGAAVAFSGTAVAQEWTPSKPLHLIVPVEGR